MTATTARSPAFVALDAHILRTAAQPEGFATTAWRDMKLTQVRGAVDRLVVTGKLHPGRAGYRTVRYFTDPGRAAEWAKQHETPDAKRSKAKKAGMALTWRGATLSKDEPAVIPPTVTVQVIAHRPGRYEVTGPIERAITNDWLAERMGAQRAATNHPNRA